MFLIVRPALSVVRKHLRSYSISLDSVTLAQYSPCESALLKRFARSEVKGQGHMCTNV